MSNAFDRVIGYTATKQELQRVADRLLLNACAIIRAEETAAEDRNWSDYTDEALRLAGLS